MGFRKLLRSQAIQFKLVDKDLVRHIVFTDPINGYQIWLTCWPVNKSKHATRQARRPCRHSRWLPRSALADASGSLLPRQQVLRSTMRRVATRSFFGGLLTGFLLAGAAGVVVARYVNRP